MLHRPRATIPRERTTSIVPLRLSVALARTDVKRFPRSSHHLPRTSLQFAVLRLSHRQQYPPMIPRKKLQRRRLIESVLPYALHPFLLRFSRPTARFRYTMLDLQPTTWLIGDHPRRRRSVVHVPMRKIRREGLTI
ncbi:hypothetical protein AB6A40_000172 [Gnathostoma spinigerum]|uniref:Uncharacterized protein n=1 Tax=Gnathostoma spinigerum TaxID=75299 RepID=A0ABD6E1L9_9BILA